MVRGRWLSCCWLGLVLVHSATGAAPPAATVPETATSWYGDMAAARAFMVDAARAYELRRRAPVTVKALGTMSALEAVARGQADLVGSARPADPGTPLERNLQFTTVAWDALALLVHPRNPVKNLSLEQLRDVFAGRISDWSALGGKPGKINVYAVAGPLDGVEWSLRRVLFGKGSSQVAARRWYINTQQLEDAIAIDPAAIGVSLNSLVAGKPTLGVLAIDGVAPSLATLEDGRYVLPTRLYVAARREAPGAPSTVQVALRARAFMRSEPALRDAWRRRQLLPASQARALRHASAAREAAIAQRLGVRLLASAPPAPSVPPPPKGTQTNPQRNAAVALSRDPPAFVFTARPATRNPSSPIAAPLATDACAPAVFCQ